MLFQKERPDANLMQRVGGGCQKEMSMTGESRGEYCRTSKQAQ